MKNLNPSLNQAIIELAFNPTISHAEMRRLIQTIHLLQDGESPSRMAMKIAKKTGEKSNVIAQYLHALEKKRVLVRRNGKKGSYELNDNVSEWVLIKDKAEMQNLLEELDAAERLRQEVIEKIQKHKKKEVPNAAPQKKGRGAK